MTSYQFELTVNEDADALGYMAEVNGRIKIFDGKKEEDVCIGEFKGYRIVPYSKENGAPVNIFYDLDITSDTAVFMELFDCRGECDLWSDYMLKRFPNLDCCACTMFFLDEVYINPGFDGQGHLEAMLKSFTSLMNLEVVLLKSYPLQWCKVANYTGRPQANKEVDLKTLRAYY